MRLVADNVSVARGGHVLFSGISFTLEKGDALLVTGPNGVGKSTLLRVLADLLPDSQGSVRLEGSDAERTAEAAHYLGHRNGMKAQLTVHENLVFWQRFMAGTGGAAIGVEEAVERVGLGGLDQLPFGYLSAGQKRRIAMARLLIVQRPLWLLDEPTAALDDGAQKLFSGLVRDHLSSQGMVIAATHHGLGLDNVRSLVLRANGEATLSSLDPFSTAVTG